MQAELINPFLTSSIQVIETLIQVKPTVGKLQVTRMKYIDHYVWLKIQIVGQVQKEIMFGFPDRLAMNMVSMMMGGYQVTELDEMCKSAVAELGNMISGNASTMLYHNGITVDITPPSLVNDDASEWGKQAMSIPLTVETVGEFDIHIMM
ncbi:chemotaxis protein CheX [Paenibacillus sp. TRM 82003]|nr:chemotaxis protein CheX [Paenibacillus sp. TRM 82003]